MKTLSLKTKNYWTYNIKHLQKTEERLHNLKHFI